ncbi:MAG: TonB-dependent receptor [Prolixibacteraceae bacterium]
MKVLFILLTVTLVSFASGSYSQTKNFTFQLRNVNLLEVFEQIEAQSDIQVAYDISAIDITKKINVDVSEESVERILQKVLEDTGLSFRVMDRYVIITKDQKTSGTESFQQRAISGKVTDTSGLPLPGVSVAIKGTAIGTITGEDGTFSLSNIPANTTLVFSFVGMVSQEVSPSGKTVIDVVMQEATVGIEEVVAVGYGTQKKVNLTGSVGSVAGDNLAGNPATSVVSSLQGRLPGVMITQSNGEPGRENISVLIRGLGTMNDASPMVIVDGLESRMDNVSPADIESVSVLKDASAAAIYGTRAANGVILVTTKRGRSGLSQINYSNSFGWQQPTNLPDHLSSAEYAELYNEGNRNEGLAERYSADDISKYRSGTDPYNFPNTDWLDLLITESGFTHDHQLSFSGGNEATSYRASFEYFDQKGLIKHSAHKRYNARINLDNRIRDWFTFGVNFGLSHNNVTNPVSPFSGGTEFFRQTNYIPPTIANKNEDGTWNRYTDGNPIAWMEAGGLSESGNSHLLGSVSGEIKLMEGLTLKNIAGINYDLSDNKTHKKTIKYGDGTIQGPNSVEDYLSRRSTITLQSFLTYDKRFGKHGVKVLLGASREAFTMKADGLYRRDFPSNDLGQINAGSTIGMTNSGYAIESRLGSHFGRINYDYDNKYLLEANLRRDASSKFARDNRVGWFPSMSAGWRVSEENFMKSVHWIHSMKLRASWGQLGNHRIDDYIYIQRVALGQNYNFGGTVADGAATIVASNSGISWEKTSEFDLGVDIDFFENRLFSLSADYYNRFTDDILTTVPVSLAFGLSAPVVNAGAMRNKGLEFLLEHHHKLGELSYGISLNAAYNKNEVEKFQNPSKGNTIRAEGVSWNSFYGYEAIGIYQTNEEAAASPHITGITVKAGDLIYKDQNKDKKIDGDDRVVLGNTIPEITFGSNISLKYKHYEFSAFFQGAGKVYRTLGSETFWPFDPENALQMHLDRTLVENGKVVKQGRYPRTVINETGNQVQSSFSILNASYVRLKNIQLGYNLPQTLLKATGLTKAKIYVTGQNIFTFTDFPEGFDPEISDDSATRSYPQVKFYTIGLDVTF